MTTGTYHYVTLSVPFEEISLDKYNIINSGYLCEVFIASQEIIETTIDIIGTIKSGDIV